MVSPLASHSITISNSHVTPIMVPSLANHYLITGGGFKHEFYFPINIYGIILPKLTFIFFKMVIAPPTKSLTQLLNMVIYSWFTH